MTLEQQNRLIFESQGWRFVAPIANPKPWIVEPCHLPRWKKGRNWAYADDVPDYVNDLNAMHEAEMSLPDTLHGRYALTLEFVCGGRANDPHNVGSSPFKCHTAKPHHRAEAIIRTLDLWIEE